MDFFIPRAGPILKGPQNNPCADIARPFLERLGTSTMDYLQDGNADSAGQPGTGQKESRPWQNWSWPLLMRSAAWSGQSAHWSAVPWVLVFLPEANRRLSMADSAGRHSRFSRWEPELSSLWSPTVSCPGQRPSPTWLMAALRLALSDVNLQPLRAALSPSLSEWGWFTGLEWNFKPTIITRPERVSTSLELGIVSLSFPASLFWLSFRLPHSSFPLPLLLSSSVMLWYCFISSVNFKQVSLVSWELELLWLTPEGNKVLNMSPSDPTSRFRVKETYLKSHKSNSVSKSSHSELRRGSVLSWWIQQVGDTWPSISPGALLEGSEIMLSHLRIENKENVIPVFLRPT